MAEAVAEEIDIGGIVSLLAGVDLTDVPDRELATLVVDAERLLNAAHCFSAMALEEFERRGAWAAEGALSAAGWVARRTGSPARTLRARVRVGAGLRQLPAVEPAARAGRLSSQHLDALARCVRRHPGLATRDEAVLVEQAERLDAEAFGVVARRWEEHAAALDSPDPAETDAADPVDELHISRTFDGRYQLDGNLSAETGELVYAALDGEVDRALRAGRDGDPSVPTVVSQVRAGALVDLLTQGMRREPSDASVPDRYRVAVVVQAEGVDDADALPLPVCDSAAFRVVLGARREVLDVGRLTQSWPAGIRRAITHRDSGCVFPGCDRPPSWCDVHHCRPWEHGGTTSVDNGALLCRRHHSFIHQHDWRVAIEAGRPVLRKPDGHHYLINRWDRADPVAA